MAKPSESSHSPSRRTRAGADASVCAHPRLCARRGPQASRTGPRQLRGPLASEPAAPAETRAQRRARDPDRDQRHRRDRRGYRRARGRPSGFLNAAGVDHLDPIPNLRVPDQDILPGLAQLAGPACTQGRRRRAALGRAAVHDRRDQRTDPAQVDLRLDGAPLEVDLPAGTGTKLPAEYSRTSSVPALSAKPIRRIPRRTRPCKS